MLVLFLKWVSALCEDLRRGQTCRKGGKDKWNPKGIELFFAFEMLGRFQASRRRKVVGESRGHGCSIKELLALYVSKHGVN